MADSNSDVFVSTDGGTNWRLHPDVPGGPTAAIKRVRDTNPALTADTDALYFATGRLTVRQYREQLVPKWSLEEVDLPATKGITDGSD